MSHKRSVRDNLPINLHLFAFNFYFRNPFHSKTNQLFLWFIIVARNRHHQRYSINNKQSDVEDSPIHSSMYAQPYLSAKLPPSQYNYTNSKNLSKTPSSENGSEATLTESELALARDNTLLVHKGKSMSFLLKFYKKWFYFFI